MRFPPQPIAKNVVGALLVAGLSIALLPPIEADAATKNLVVNGSFSAKAKGWRVSPAKTSRLSIIKSKGNRIARLRSTVAGGRVVLNDKRNTVKGGDAGVTYRVSLRVRSNKSGSIGTLRVREVSNGKVITHRTPIEVADRSWHRVGFEFTTTLADSSLDLNVIAPNMARSRRVYVDSISLKVRDEVPEAVPTPAPTVGPTATATPTAKVTSTASATPTTRTTSTASATPTTKTTSTASATPTTKTTNTASATPTTKTTNTASATPTTKATNTASATPTSSATASKSPTATAPATSAAPIASADPIVSVAPTSAAPTSASPTASVPASGAYQLSDGCWLNARGVGSCAPMVGAAHGSNTDPTALENSLGKHLSIRRTYWGASQVASAVRTAKADVAAGRIPWISFKLGYSWTEMAAGKGDAWARDLTAKLATVNGPVWVAFHHEPEGDGTITSWTKMQERLGPIVRTAPNVAFTVILTGWNQLYGQSQYSLESLWPKTTVDVAGFDIYCFYGTYLNGKYRTPDPSLKDDYFVPISKWAKSKGVAWGLAETGLTDAASKAHPQWIQSTYQELKDTGALAMSYFDTSLNTDDVTWLTPGVKTEDFKATLKLSPSFPKQ